MDNGLLTDDGHCWRGRIPDARDYMYFVRSAAEKRRGNKDRNPVPATIIVSTAVFLRLYTPSLLVLLFLLLLPRIERTREREGYIIAKRELQDGLRVVSMIAARGESMFRGIARKVSAGNHYGTEVYVVSTATHIPQRFQS